MKPMKSEFRAKLNGLEVKVKFRQIQRGWYEINVLHNENPISLNRETVKALLDKRAA